MSHLTSGRTRSRVLATIVDDVAVVVALVVHGNRVRPQPALDADGRAEGVERFGGAAEDDVVVAAVQEEGQLSARLSALWMEWTCCRSGRRLTNCGIAC